MQRFLHTSAQAGPRPLSCQWCRQNLPRKILFLFEGNIATASPLFFLLNFKPRSRFLMKTILRSGGPRAAVCPTLTEKPRPRGHILRPHGLGRLNQQLLPFFLGIKLECILDGLEYPARFHALVIRFSMAVTTGY